MRQLPSLISAQIAVLCLGWLPVAGIAAAQDPEPEPEMGDYSLLTLGPGDVLQISVLGVPELKNKVRVFEDGTITLPLVGELPLTGLTVREAEGEIARMLSSKGLVNDPQVSIFVAKSVRGGVTVQGAVKQPGVYDLYGQRTLLEILGRAGGLNKERGAEILILRNTGSEGQESIQVDASRLVEEGDISLNIELEPGDIVMVPVSRTLRVYVTGAVKRPGAVEYSSSEGITILQAITAAGGPTERANLKKVTLRRRLADGTEESLKINVKKIQSGKEPDIPLKRNDTVVVAEWLL